MSDNITEGTSAGQDPEVRHPDDIGYDPEPADEVEHHPQVEDERPHAGITAPDMEAAE